MWKQVIKFFGDENTKTLKSFQKQADKINELEPAMQALKNEDFPVKTGEFKKRIHGGESLDELIPETFALVREASKRVIGERHFDVQLLGGLALHYGCLLYTSPSPRDGLLSRMPSSA